MSKATNNQQSTLAKRTAPPPAFDPERPMLVQPWRDFEGRGWVEVQYFGGAITRSVKIKLLHGDLLSDKDTKAADGSTFVGPQEAKDRIVRSGLWTPKGDKKVKPGGQAEEQLPKRSLTKKDFDGNVNSLAARARSVAMTLGERTAAGRIGSMELTREGKTTLAQWWKGAGGQRKARLLTDKKHFDSLVKADWDKLNEALNECPFRGDEPVPGEKKEEGVRTELPLRESPPKQGKTKKGKKEVTSNGEVDA